ncbi:hypothetical protein [Candidatus Nitrospira bockiana]
MPKLITTHRAEDESLKAKEYIRTHVLLPSSLLGLVFMVAGMASLVYQFFSISYGWRTFVETVLLLGLGVLLGWTQTRYQQYLLREFPGHFSGRLRIFAQDPRKRPAKDMTIPDIHHRGRQLVPLAYTLGAAALFGASAVISVFGTSYYVAAFLMPWVGFFWAKVYFWRGILIEASAHKPGRRR